MCETCGQPVEGKTSDSEQSQRLSPMSGRSDTLPVRRHWEPPDAKQNDTASILG